MWSIARLNDHRCEQLDADILGPWYDHALSQEERWQRDKDRDGGTTSVRASHCTAVLPSSLFGCRRLMPLSVQPQRLNPALPCIYGTALKCMGLSRCRFTPRVKLSPTP